MTQLSEAIRRLDANGIVYWLDAGSLLGVVRDGSLLPWDKDIDFGCWNDSIPPLRRVVEEFRSVGYNARLHQYRGDLYQIKLRPPISSLLGGERSIDITIFRREGSRAWCPINCVDPQPASRFSLVWWLQKPVRELAIRPWERSSSRRAKTTSFPRLRLETRTWVVPLHYYDTLDELVVDGVKVSAPKESHDYLTLRYGDWRVPRTLWNYCEDDGLIDSRPPELVLEDIRNAKHGE